MPQQEPGGKEGPTFHDASNGFPWTVMELKAAVEKYLEAVQEFCRPMPLSQFGLPKEEVEAMVSAWEEDYQVHRHLELIPASTAGQNTPVYRIGGLLYTAIVFRESIRHVLP